MEQFRNLVEGGTLDGVHKKYMKTFNSKIKLLKDDIKSGPTNVYGRLEDIQILIDKWREEAKDTKN